MFCQRGDYSSLRNAITYIFKKADPRLEGQKNVSAMICVPLAKERVLGAIAIGTPKTDSYKAEHLKLVSIFASQSAIAIDKALLWTDTREFSSVVLNQVKGQNSGFRFR